MNQSAISCVVLEMGLGLAMYYRGTLLTNLAIPSWLLEV